MIQVVENCTLEWDAVRGVLYVHNKETGATVLRICRLPRFVAGTMPRLSEGQIDVTIGVGVSMPEGETPITWNK